MADEITADEVANHLQKETIDLTLQLIATEVTAMVTEWHGEDWPAGVKLGALMLAARLDRRRNSPNGVESFSDMGTTYVARFDSDLERQLRIGKWTSPAVG